jgi:predicted DNA-binding transcriptional regulator AlpA
MTPEQVRATHSKSNAENACTHIQAALLTVSEVGKLVSLSRATIYVNMREGTFPRPVEIPGVRSSRWRRSDVEAWLAALQLQATG